MGQKHFSIGPGVPTVQGFTNLICISYTSVSFPLGSLKSEKESMKLL